MMPKVFTTELTMEEVDTICKALCPPSFCKDVLFAMKRYTPLQFANLSKRDEEWRERYPNLYKMHEIREMLRTLEFDLS